MKKILTVLSLVAILSAVSPVMAAPGGPGGPSRPMHTPPPPHHVMHARAGWNAPPPPPPRYHHGHGHVTVGGVLARHGYWGYPYGSCQLSFCTNPYYNYQCYPYTPYAPGYTTGVYVRF